MILQNKKTGKRVYMKAEEYQTLKDVGFANGWTIISRDDQDELPKRELPKDILDFSQIKKPKKKKNG